MARLQLKNVNKRWGSFVGVDNFNLDIADQEFLVLLGPSGCGTKDGLAAFRNNWQLPLRAAFTDRSYKTDRFICEGEWASCFGHIEGTHSGVFMGIAPTGKRVTIPYMDFWKIEDGRIKDNWVSVDFPSVLAQLGRDVFDGRGWEHFDDGSATPPHPA
jgi:predicted ester cyclase